MENNISDIYQLLSQKRLKEALKSLLVIAIDINAWNLKEEIDAILISYEMMLKYTLQGIKDPNQKEMIIKMTRQAYNITDRVVVLKSLISSTSQYTELIKKKQVNPGRSFEEILLQLESYTQNMGTVDFMYSSNNIEDAKKEIVTNHEHSVNELFEKVWTNLKWSDTDKKDVETILDSLLVDSYDKAILVSAITMSLLHIFDINKFMLLLDCCEKDNINISQRAIVGAIFIFLNQEDKIELYPEVGNRIKIMIDNSSFCKDVQRIQLHLLMTRETLNINKKMREEIIPEMMKNPKSLNFKIDLEEMEENEDKNPDWEKFINDSGVNEKIKEIGELQLEGADIYMETFSMLKNYNFFFTTSHWFYPFFNKQANVYQILKDEDTNKISILNLILKSSIFCNSDKYSLCFTLGSLPESQRSLIINQLNEQNQFSEEQLSSLNDMSEKSDNSNIISRQYVHDLYRFFKLWQFRKEEKDIFDGGYQLWKNKYLKSIIDTPETLKRIAEFLLKKNYMEEAAEVYALLTNKEPLNSELWQKRGYALQKSGKYTDAINSYIQSDIMHPDNVWTNHRLAQCYKKSGDFAKAVEYYKKVEEIQENNLNITLQIAQCLIKAGSYKEALPYFFKLEYINNSNDNSKRAIGWCYFILRDYEKSLTYFEKVINDGKANMQDYMNIGHINLAMNNLTTAVEYYKKADSLCKNHEKFFDIFNSDKPDLIKQGISESLISIVPDLLI